LAAEGDPAEVAAGLGAGEGAKVLRSFAKIFFNLTIEAAKRRRFGWLCNHRYAG
jgi:hypothetical protein